MTSTLSARPVATAAAATVRLVAPDPPIWSTLCDQTGLRPRYSANSMLWENGMCVIRPLTWSFVSPASSTQSLRQLGGQPDRGAARLAPFGLDLGEACDRGGAAD